MSKIYIVLRNADMCEGRGPMTFNSAFLDKKKALEYASSQEGVMGTTQHDYVKLHGPYRGYRGRNIQIIGETIFYDTFQVIECEEGI